MIALISVYNTQEPERSMYERFLYDLLDERKPYQNISHSKTPSYKEHVNFVRSKPYKGWYIVQDLEGKFFVGSVYLGEENNVGIFIREKYWGMHYGTKMLDIIYELYPHIKTIYANVSPTNQRSMAFFLNKGYKLHNYTEDGPKIIQYTYKKTNPCYVEHDQQEVKV